MRIVSEDKTYYLQEDLGDTLLFHAIEKGRATKMCIRDSVSAEVIATDYEGMIREGEELAALNPHIVVKVPCIADGIKAVSYTHLDVYKRQPLDCG